MKSDAQTVAEKVKRTFLFAIHFLSAISFQFRSNFPEFELRDLHSVRLNRSGLGVWPLAKSAAATASLLSNSLLILQSHPVPPPPPPHVWSPPHPQ